MTRILLAEPDSGQADQLRASLSEHADWEVTCVGSVLEAIREAGERSYDAAILDYDLPDGSGVDILDFLRIGSPGIRIVVVGAKRSEDVVFHALSHGAGDYVVKDKHLAVELPRRLDTLLDNPVSAERALVETILPSTYEQQRVATPPASSAVGADELDGDAESALQTCLHELVTGPVIAAGVFDHLGHPKAAQLIPDMDADGLGFSLATMHGQVGAVWTYGNIKPVGYAMIVDVEGGLLGITAIPGTFLVALLFEAPLSRHRALEKLEQAAARITAALQA